MFVYILLKYKQMFKSVVENQFKNKLSSVQLGINVNVVFVICPHPCSFLNHV